MAEEIKHEHTAISGEIVKASYWNAAHVIEDDAVKEQHIKDGNVSPDKLKAVDAPADGEFPSFNQAQNKFEWKPPNGGGVGPTNADETRFTPEIDIPNPTTGGLIHSRTITTGASVVYAHTVFSLWGDGPDFWFHITHRNTGNTSVDISFSSTEAPIRPISNAGIFAVEAGDNIFDIHVWVSGSGTHVRIPLGALILLEFPQ